MKKLEAFGSRHSATASQVALAWLLAQDELVIPIPGTRSVERSEGKPRRPEDLAERGGAKGDS